MIDIDSVRALRRLAAAVITLGHAAQRGAHISVQTRADERGPAVWVLTVDAIAIGGSIWSAGDARIDALLLAAQQHIHAQAPTWEVINPRKAT